MSREQLARVFPDGRTVHIPTDGRPFSGYALALADIRKRGGDPSSNSLEAAREAGIDVGSAANTEVATNDEKAPNLLAKLFGARKTDDEDDSEAAAAESPAKPAVVAAATKPKPTILAQVENKAAAAAKAGKTALSKVGARLTRPTAAALVPANDAADKPKDAAAERPKDAVAEKPKEIAALSPSQVISARGYWQGLPELNPAAPVKPAVAAARLRRTEVANAVPDVTGAVSPWTAEDRAAPEIALSFAEQPGRDSPLPQSALGTAMARAAAKMASRLINQNGMTIAAKGVVDAPQTLTLSIAEAATGSLDTHFANPWMRAVVMSPSVRRYLSITALGTQDMTTLGPMLRKPASSIMAMFSADPNRGLTHDRFSGSAIVSVPTVTYGMQAASLR